MNRGIASLDAGKPKSTRSLLWYVDILVVAGVLGVVAALVLINFALV